MTNTASVAEDTFGHEEVEEVGGTVSLEDPFGRGEPCETCGPSYDNIEWYLDVETDLIHVHASVGCYGGESRSSANVEEIAEFLLEHGDRFPHASLALRAEVDLMRTAVAAART